MQGSTERKSNSHDSQKPAGGGPKSLTWRRKEADRPRSPQRQASVDRRSQTSPRSQRQGDDDRHSASAETSSRTLDPEALSKTYSPPTCQGEEASEPMMETERTLACLGQMDMMWQARYTMNS